MNALVCLHNRHAEPVDRAHDRRTAPEDDPIQRLAVELAKRIVAETKALDPRDNILIGEVIEKHLRYCKNEVCAEHNSNRSKHLKDFSALHAHKRIEECTPLDLQEFIERPAWKSHTRNNARSHILRCFNWAKKSRLVRENPFEGCPKTPQGPRGRPMAHNVYQALMRHSKPHFRRLLAFMSFTGCRPCEASTLRWKNIVWGKSVAILPEHKTAKKTGEPRILYLTPPVVKLLRWLNTQRFTEPAAVWMAKILREGPLRTRELASLARRDGFTTRQVYRAIRTVGVKLKWHRVPGSNADKRFRHKTIKRKMYMLSGEPRLPKVDDPREFVFLTLKQTPWCRRSIALNIFRLCKKGKLPAGTHAYALRHRAATEAMRAGIDLLIVSKFLGHKSVKTTQIYTSTIGEDTAFILDELAKIPRGPRKAAGKRCQP